MTTTATTSPAVMFVKVSRIAPIWPRTATDAPRGGAPARAIACIDLADGPSQVLPGDVRRQRDHPLTVDAIVFADDRGVPDRRHVAEQRVRAAFGAHRNHAQILETGHPRLRHLDLHLERDAGARIGPVVRRDEPARRGRRGKRAPDLIDGDAELTRHLTVHVDLNRRIVERLAVLQIAKRGNPRELVPDLGRERPAGRRNPGR